MHPGNGWARARTREWLLLIKDTLTQTHTHTQHKQATSPKSNHSGQCPNVCRTSMASPPLSDNGLCRPDTEWVARTLLELTFISRSGPGAKAQCARSREQRRVRYHMRTGAARRQPDTASLVSLINRVRASALHWARSAMRRTACSVRPG